MSPWTKVGAVIGVLVLLTCVVLIMKWQHDLIARQDAFEKSIVEMKQLGDGIVRAQSQYVSKKDLEDFAKGIDLKKIQADLDKLHAEIQGVSIMVASTPGFNGRGLPSSGTIHNPGSIGDNSGVITCPNGGTVTCPNSDKYGYLNYAQVFNLNEPLNNSEHVPFGSVTFNAWQEKPWDVLIYPRNYKISTVLGQDEDGRHYVYNKFSIESNGETHVIPIQQAKFEELLPSSSFKFSPRLYVGGDIGSYITPTPQAELSPNLQVSLFSYGKTKIDPDWTFVGIGVGYESQAHRPNVMLTPFTYNVAHHLPLVTNIQVGHSISMDTAGSFAVYLGFRFGL